MKRFYILMLAFLNLLANRTQAQGNGFDSLYAFHPDSAYWRNVNLIENVLPLDSQIIVSGRTLLDTNYRPADLSQVVFISGFNYNGTKLWERQLRSTSANYPGTYRFFRPKLLEKLNNNRIVTAAMGRSIFGQIIQNFPFLEYFSSNGDSIKRIELNFDPQYSIVPYSLYCDKWKNVLLSGTKWNNIPPEQPLDSALMFINKYDSLGNQRWERLYIGLGGPERGLRASKFLAANGNQTDYLMVGKSGIGDSMAAARQSMMMIARMDSAGNLIWMKTLPKMRDYFVQGVADYYEDLIPATNGSGYYFLGYESKADTSSMPTYYVGKIDEDGNVLWAKQYIFPGISDVYTFDINQKRNGDLLLSANIVRNQPYLRKSPYILCIDSTGNVKWGKEFRRFTCGAPISAVIGEQIFQTSLGPDDKIVMGGNTVDGYYTPTPCYPYNFAMARLVVTDSMGRVDPTDTIYDTTQIQVVTFPLKLKNVALPTARLVLYPNPATQELNVLLANLQPAQNDELQISDIQGKAVLSGKMHGGQAVIGVSHLPPGTYLLRHFRKGVLQASAKFVKQ